MRSGVENAPANSQELRVAPPAPRAEVAVAEAAGEVAAVAASEFSCSPSLTRTATAS